MKKNNNKGFTLAELLIVVAIIAVLVAIAIPVLNTSLEKSRQAADAANIRAAYAQAVANTMVNGSSSGDALTAAKMKTSSFEKLQNDGDTLAGLTWDQFDEIHVAGYKILVEVDASTSTKVKFYQADDNGKKINATKYAEITLTDGSVAAATTGSGSGS